MDLFIRKMNLQLYEREFPVLSSKVVPGRRGLVNEVAFSIFCQLQDRLTQPRWEDANIQRAMREATEKVASLEKVSVEKIEAMNDVEIKDCDQQVKRLQTFFIQQSKRQPLIVRPRFPGAGIIDSCEGDVMFGSNLFEVKAGQRTFRAVDLKQLLIYAALNRSAHMTPIIELGLFNPRMGISFRSSIDSICLEISGCAAAELLPEIIRILSSGDLSR
jgi:hypothetical protein